MLAKLDLSSLGQSDKLHLKIAKDLKLVALKIKILPFWKLQSIMEIQFHNTCSRGLSSRPAASFDAFSLRLMASI